MITAYVLQAKQEVDRMNTFVHETILISKEAHIFLEAESRRQRGCKPLTEEQVEKVWRRIHKYKDTQMRQVDCDTYGGGDGTYNGKWWSWDLDTIKKMLSEEGFTWVYAEPIEGCYV